MKEGNAGGETERNSVIRILAERDDEIIYLNNSQKDYTRGGEPHHSKPGRGVGVP